MRKKSRGRTISIEQGKWKLWELKCQKCGGIVLRVKKRVKATCFNCKKEGRKKYSKKYKKIDKKK